MTEPLSTQPAPVPTSTPDNDEIDLIALAHILWDGRRTIFKTIGIFVVLGILVALFSSKEYTASTTIVPQMADAQSKLGGLSGLASMAGINLNMMGNTSDITPAVYPEIITSVPFQLELMQTPLDFKNINYPITLYDYYTEHKTPSAIGYVLKFSVGLPSLIFKAIKEEEEEEEEEEVNSTNIPLRLTEEQREVSKNLNKLISIDYNDKDGYVTLTCRMTEALAAAQLAQQTQELLQRYITVFKIQKAKANLDFVEQRYNEVKKQYEQAQSEFATFRDRNRNVATATAQTEEERLNNNYNLVYDVYSELAKQLEQARIQVKEDTPVFTIIKPVSVPLERSKPKRLMILIIWLFLGCIIGTGIVFSRGYLETFKKHWNSIDSV